MSTVVNISIAPSNDNPITLPIASTPGTYIAVLRMGGRDYVKTITVGASDSEMENVFNQNSLNTLTIYEADGETILDDTIYNISVDPTVNTTVNNIYKVIVETMDGMTSYSNGAIRGASSVSVFTETGYMHGATISSPASDTINFPYALDARQRLEIIITR